MRLARDYEALKYFKLLTIFDLQDISSLCNVDFDSWFLDSAELMKGIQKSLEPCNDYQEILHNE